MDEQYLTVREAATYLGLSRWTVRRYVDLGELSAIKGDGERGAFRISASSVRAYIQRHTVTAEE
ncbi:helix-turn-helix domain-containing protein [Micromonospora echinospora]